MGGRASVVELSATCACEPTWASAEAGKASTHPQHRLTP
jgi:hypothetical protein